MRNPKLHRMKLKTSPFRKIQNGSKTIELRLNDEKRQQVQYGTENARQNYRALRGELVEIHEH